MSTRVSSDLRFAPGITVLDLLEWEEVEATSPGGVMITNGVSASGRLILLDMVGV